LADYTDSSNHFESDAKFTGFNFPQLAAIKLILPLKIPNGLPRGGSFVAILSGPSYRKMSEYQLKILVLSIE
jgi:hypothetical protein